MSIQNSAVLTIIYPTISLDFHDTWPIGSPAPSPAPTPYGWVQVLGGLSMPTVKKALRTYSLTFPIIQRGSDIGPLIVHVGTPSYLLPFIILGSGSATEFGAFTVKVENQPVGTAFPMKFATLNLNCQGSAIPPCALPTGLVLAPSTVFAGMSIGDIVASLVCMAADMLVSYALGKLSSFLNGRYILQHISGPIAVRIFGAAYNASPLIRAFTLNIPPLISGAFGLGSPVGYSAGYTPAGLYGTGRDKAAQAIADYLNPAPGATL